MTGVPSPVDAHIDCGRGYCALGADERCPHWNGYRSEPHPDCTARFYVHDAHNFAASVGDDGVVWADCPGWLSARPTDDPAQPAEARKQGTLFARWQDDEDNGWLTAKAPDPPAPADDR